MRARENLHRPQTSEVKGAFRNMNIVEKSKEKYLEYERRQQEILDVAIRIFNSKGYRSSTTAEIAKEAGVSEPTLYKHFPSKKDLFLKCVHSIEDELQRQYRTLYLRYRDHGDEVRYMDGVTRVYVDFVKNKPHKSMFMIHLLSYKEDPDFSKVLGDWIRASIIGIERILASAKKKGRIKSPLDPYTLACVYVNQYFTIVALKEFMEPSRFKAKALIQWMRGMLGIHTDA